MLSTAVPVKGVGWTLVDGFVESCVKSWLKE